MLCFKFILFMITIPMLLAKVDVSDDDNKNMYDQNGTLIYDNDSSSIPDNAADVMRQVIAKKCTHHYSLLCLKIDAVRLLDIVGTTDSYQLLPGISIVNSKDTDNNQRSKLLPSEIALSILKNNTSQNELDTYLVEKADRVMNSLSIKVNLSDNPIMETMRNMATQVTGVFEPRGDVSSGRGKKHKGDMSAALWSAAALGLSAIAAIAGKALMTATVALILSIMCLLKGCSHGKSSHYEIITKPAHIHDHVEHAFSSPYNYARHLVEERVIPALNVVRNATPDLAEDDSLQPYEVAPAYIVEPN